MAAQSAGLAFPDLCERIVQLALSRAAATDDVSS
jgi:hypothetical protein